MEIQPSRICLTSLGNQVSRHSWPRFAGHRRTVPPPGLFSWPPESLQLETSWGLAGCSSTGSLGEDLLRGDSPTPLVSSSSFSISYLTSAPPGIRCPLHPRGDPREALFPCLEEATACLSPSAQHPATAPSSHLPGGCPLPRPSPPRSVPVSSPAQGWGWSQDCGHPGTPQEGAAWEG